jgi:DNA mismatch endonuclease (patch repair protein)
MTLRTDESRRANMRAVRATDTRPEMAVRKAAHGIGLRYRLHSRALPGTPDMVFPRWRTVVFVNGCFWHQHPGCKKSVRPSTNCEFWDAKLTRNVERDGAVTARLSALGWRVIVIWECEARDAQCLETILKRHFA